MFAKDISIFDFTYTLDPSRIAHHPVAERDSSKLLVYRNQQITEDIYRNIDNYLPASSLLVLNDTRVVEARLLFQKPSGGMIEIFCLEPHAQYKDITTAMTERSSVMWMCLIGGASKWKSGQLLQQTIDTNNHTFVLTARFIDKKDDRFTIELSWSATELTFAEVLHLAGNIPLPPYIKRSAEAVDAERYQTTYANADGSVAAPTAGLHFTKEIFDRLRARNITTAFLTLHVGAGTFKPVKADRMLEHEMHAEFIDVTLNSVKNIIEKLNSDIVAVGTTSLRTLESLYWLGVKTINNIGLIPDQLRLEQWDAYELANDSSPDAALQSLINWMERNDLTKLVTTTRLLIVPGYNFKIVTGLVTNFHQPQSTLLLLVAAFIGEDWRKVYDHALNNNFRFLSYGDGCLFLRH
ncbi:MAG: S-adenosylmethionine:tRNA ribosyltransferase-isomerase [Chitinophagaceae bacterium]|nr:S-adenosylmethionine:tRNA ribosyltransferase-isomerase [Chitinophagaceae bacterium]